MEKSSSFLNYEREFESHQGYQSRISLAAERLLAMQETRVRFPYLAPHPRSLEDRHLSSKQVYVGSNPTEGTIGVKC